MRDRLEILVTMLVAVLFAAGVGSAFGAEPSARYLAPDAQQQEPPKDCKKNPDDPRCKDERKY